MVVFGRIISTLLRNTQLDDVTHQYPWLLDQRNKLKSAEPAVCTANLLIRVSLDVTQCRWASVYRHLNVVLLKHRLIGPRSTQPLNLWRWRQYFPSKRREKVTQQHRVTFQMTRVLNLQSTSFCFQYLFMPSAQRLVAYIARIVYPSVSQPLWDRGPVNSFFTRRGPGPNKFTRKYLPIFLSSYIKLT